MEPVVFLKAKYAAPKTRGKFAGGAKADRHGPKKHAKNAKHIKPNFSMLMVLDLENGGKIRWEKVYA